MAGERLFHQRINFLFDTAHRDALVAMQQVKSDFIEHHAQGGSREKVALISVVEKAAQAALIEAFKSFDIAMEKRSESRPALVAEIRTGLSRYITGLLPKVRNPAAFAATTKFDVDAAMTQAEDRLSVLIDQHLSGLTTRSPSWTERGPLRVALITAIVGAVAATALGMLTHFVFGFPA